MGLHLIQATSIVVKSSRVENKEKDSTKTYTQTMLNLRVHHPRVWSLQMEQSLAQQWRFLN